MNQMHPSTSGCHRLARVVSVILGIALLGSGQTANAEPPLGSRSFLAHHVHSVAELKRALDTDPRLIRVYSELLHMSPAEVKSEFARLKLVRLPEEGVYKVYGVFTTPAGLQYSFKVRRLPKGIDVFTLEDGKTPVILKQCGNLLRGYYTTPGPIANSVPVFNEVNPDAGLPIAPGPSPETITLDTPVDTEWGWVEDTTATAPGPAIMPPPALAHTVRAAWWPWLFPIIGIPFIGGGGGGGRGGGFTSGPFPVFVPSQLSSIAAIVQPSIDIPEPGAVSLLVSLTGAGAGVLFWHRRRGAKRRAARSGKNVS